MKTAILLVITGLAAGAVAVVPAKPKSGHVAEAPTARTCIPLDRIAARRTVGASAIEFDLAGGMTYRNDLARPCPGMERLGTSAAVAVASGAETGMLCAGDRVKIFDPVEVKATGLRTYPDCQLGKFTLVSHGAYTK